MKTKILMTILNILPKNLSHKIMFRLLMRRKLDLKNPKTLNEKIHWLILNYYGKKEAKLTDKYLVKEYINKLNIKDLNVPKTYFAIDDVDDKINLKKLPNQFVLKCNHGSGDVIICLNKNEFDFENSLNKLSKLLKKDFSKNLLEYHYSYIEPKIICEEYIDDKKNSRPVDYKFFCFSGMVRCVMVCTNRTENGYNANFFDKDWNELNYSTHPSSKKITKPDNFSVMWDIASKISQNEKFVRVDLYNANGKIYFSEMTFTPAAGLSRTYTKEADLILGSCIDINEK